MIAVQRSLLLFSHPIIRVGKIELQAVFFFKGMLIECLKYYEVLIEDNGLFRSYGGMQSGDNNCIVANLLILAGQSLTSVPMSPHL